MVKVGGKIYRKLVNEGALQMATDDSHALYSLQENDNVEELKQKYNKELPPNMVAVRGRGAYKNKLVKRLLPQTVNSNSTKRIISRTKSILQEHPEISEDEIEALLLQQPPELRRQESGQVEEYRENNLDETETEMETEMEETEMETELEENELDNFEFDISDDDDEYF